MPIGVPIGVLWWCSRSTTLRVPVGVPIGVLGGVVLYSTTLRSANWCLLVCFGGGVL